MLEKISDVPNSVLGFRASGELTSDDYRNALVPAVKAALQSRDKLRLLYLLGDDIRILGRRGLAGRQGGHGARHPMGEDRCRDRQGVTPALRQHLRLPDPGGNQGLPAAEEWDARALVAS